MASKLSSQCAGGRGSASGRVLLREQYSMLAGDGQGWQQCERVGRDQLGTGRGCEQEVAEMPSDSSSARSWSGITIVLAEGFEREACQNKHSSARRWIRATLVLAVNESWYWHCVRMRLCSIASQHRSVRRWVWMTTVLGMNHHSTSRGRAQEVCSSMAGSCSDVHPKHVIRMTNTTTCTNSSAASPYCCVLAVHSCCCCCCCRQ